MLHRLTRKKSGGTGFTLIEIVLVLALAGLLLIIVLQAVSSAQRARRDFQRKDDLALINAAFQSYAANHQGKVPTTQAEADDVFNNYLTANIKDPLTGSYSLVFRDLDAPHSDIPDVATVYYQQGHWCNIDATRGGVGLPDDPIAGNDTLVNKFAVWTGLEAGGLPGGSLTSGAFICIDNY
jgi:type II secretory pathway pseudopilin PulG